MALMTIGEQRELMTSPDVLNPIWVTAMKDRIPVREMETTHIHNCIRCWKGEGKMKIPDNYMAGKIKWLNIFNAELIRRQ